MSFWQIPSTLISAIVLMDAIWGKEITSQNGASLGVVIDIKLDLMLGKTWAIVENQRQLTMIPSEQISILTDRIILSPVWLPA